MCCQTLFYRYDGCDYFKTINRISFRRHSATSFSSFHQQQSNDNHLQVERHRSFITGRASNYYYYYFINNETRQKQRTQLSMLSAAIHVWHIDLTYTVRWMHNTLEWVSSLCSEFFCFRLHLISYQRGSCLWFYIVFCCRNGKFYGTAAWIYVAHTHPPTRLTANLHPESTLENENRKENM